MSQTSRELLLTTKSVRQWQDTFDAQVDSLIEIINRVDTFEAVVKTTEVLDVYRHTAMHATRTSRRRNKIVVSERPFEFLTFCN